MCAGDQTNTGYATHAHRGRDPTCARGSDGPAVESCGARAAANSDRDQRQRRTSSPQTKAAARLLSQVALLVVVALQCVAARADWKVEIEWDPVTDERSAVAYTTIAGGHRLGIWLPGDGSVRASLNTGFAPIELRDQPVLTRIDADQVVDLHANREALQVRSADHDAVGWRIGRSRDDPVLQQFLAAKRLLIRVHDSEGKPRDLVFDLAGVDRAYQLAAELQP